MFYCLISVFFNSIALQTHYFAFIFVRFRTRKFILPSKVEAVVVVVVDVEVEINFIPLNQQGGIYTSLLLSRNCNHRVSLAWRVG